MTLEVRGLTFSYGRREVLRGIDLDAGTGIVSLIGPNGAGKSTFVKCLSGALHPSGGEAEFDGMSMLDRASRKKMRLAYMPQDPPQPTSMSVLEVMLLGRLESLSFAVSDEDVDSAYGTLEMLDLAHLAEHPFNALSGGQAQMVMIAQCLVSEPELMILDEPMNNLDLRRELDMFDVMRQVTDGMGMTTLMVLHDINFAARFSDRIVIMKDGEVYAEGTPKETVTAGMIRDVYGVESTVGRDGLGNPRVEPVHSVEKLTVRMRRKEAETQTSDPEDVPARVNTHCQRRD